jgi:hypothetical protein
MTTIEKETCVPLCPKHYSGMKSSEVCRLDPVSYEPKKTPSFRCMKGACHWTYSLSNGYYRFREGEPVEIEESLHFLCPEHRHPLYISGYDGQSKIETWRCPEVHCVTVTRRRE